MSGRFRLAGWTLSAFVVASALCAADAFAADPASCTTWSTHAAEGDWMGSGTGQDLGPSSGICPSRTQAAAGEGKTQYSCTANAYYFSEFGKTNYGVVYAVWGTRDGCEPSSGWSEGQGSAVPWEPIPPNDAAKAFAWGISSVLICYLAAWCAGRILNMIDPGRA